MATGWGTACGALTALLSLCVGVALGDALPPVPTECLVLPRMAGARRSPAPRDSIADRLLHGPWAAPRVGDAVALPDGSSIAWEACAANGEGWFEHRALAGGYAFLPIESASDRIVFLEAQGHSMAFVNGEPRAGDVYSNGWVRIPILLRKGANELLFLGGRGRLRVALVEPEGPATLDARDTTLPDAVVGEATDSWGAVVVENASQATARGLVLSAALGAADPVASEVPPLLPLSARKVGFRIAAPAIVEAGPVPLALRLLDGEGREVGAVRLEPRARGPQETRKITFRSAIDGSVQYYALNPASDAGGAERPALILSCHGAAVEAIGQADAYGPRSWAHIVAPTNRRPYGFDWEDWGRLDAMEVLEDAQRRLNTDPTRTYLTGHSMGGHGAWHLAVTYPDRFAATGPSAGWISLWGRGRTEPTQPAEPFEEILRRSMSPSDTVTLAPNLADMAVYILHGEKDDNVPVTEARAMRDLLATFHHDFEYHEQPGAGHWWDDSEEPGAACVDWPPMFQLFARHRLPSDDEVRDIAFTTMSPTVSSTSHWARIEAQRREFLASTVRLHWDPTRRVVSGTTDNVARLRLALPRLAPAASVRVLLDGGDLTVETDPNYGGAFWLARGPAGWELTAPPASTAKGPERGGPFRAAFTNRAVLVYGTRGTSEEKAWALARARYDAEVFWCQANGSFDVVADSEFDPEAFRDRNVILYGNRDTNAAWAQVLRADEPADLSAGRVVVGERALTGPGVACLVVRPRADSHEALVGVVGGTDLHGMRTTDRLGYFSSGMAYPDLVLYGPNALAEGVGGVLAAGSFGENWDVENGEFVWRE